MLILLAAILILGIKFKYLNKHSVYRMNKVLSNMMNKRKSLTIKTV